MAFDEAIGIELHGFGLLDSLAFMAYLYGTLRGGAGVESQRDLLTNQCCIDFVRLQGCRS